MVDRARVRRAFECIIRNTSVLLLPCTAASACNYPVDIADESPLELRLESYSYVSLICTSITVLAGMKLRNRSYVMCTGRTRSCTACMQACMYGAGIVP